MSTSTLPRFTPFLFAALLLTGLFFGLRQAQPVYAADTDIRINEFMASNQTTLADEDGAYSDWLELYNAGVDPVDLTGWYLTDNALQKNKWQMPAVTLNPGGYLVIFASGKNRSVVGNPLHTNFSLSAAGEYLGLIKPDGTTVIDEYAPTFPAMAADQAYGVIAPGVRGYLSTATPGATNDTAVPLVTISAASGLFTTSVNVTLSSPYLAPGDQIRYTTNGSEPTAASTLYTAPFNITASTRLRARVVRSGLLGQTNYAVYIKLDPALASFNSNLPLVVVETFNVALGTGTTPSQAAVVIIPVGNGPLLSRAQIIDAPEYAGLSGMRIRGSSSGGFPKKQYSMDLWNDYVDSEIDASLLGLPTESDWILHAPGRYDRNMVSNPFAHTLAQAMGMTGFDGEFVELYLNDNSNSNTAVVDASDYDGIYILMESIKPGSDRVDITKMDPTDTADPAITGGYMWSIDRSDFNEYAFRLAAYNNYPGNESGGGSSWVNITYPNADVLTTVQRVYFENYINDFAGAITGPNPNDPLVGYPNYIDIDSWVDGYLLDVFVKDPDALRLSHFFTKPRYGKLYNDIAWDYDRTMGSTDGRDLNPCLAISYVPTFNPAGNNAGLFDYWEQLLEDPNFYVATVDRWYDMRLHGPFQTSFMYPIVDGLSGQLTEAYPREMARWDVPANTNYGPRNTNPNVCGFSQTLDTYQKEVDFFKWWLNQRMVWMDDTYFNVHPPTVGVVGSTAVITRPASAPLAAVLYYTLDGSDPRLPGGGLSPTAVAYTGAIPLSQTARINARTYDPAQGTARQWSALGYNFYQHTADQPQPGDLLVSEIYYNPADDNAFEFLEFTNNSNHRLDLTGVQVRSAISHTFGTTYLDPGDFIVLVNDAVPFQWLFDRYDSPWYYAGITYEEWTSGSLDNAGETILLNAADGVTPLLTFTYDDTGAWPGRADGNGSAAELILPVTLPLTATAQTAFLSDGNNWRPTSEYHGSPGRYGLGPDGRVLFNEILAHTDDPLTDTVELYNTLTTTVDISNWVVSDSNNDYRKFKIYGGTTLAPHSFISFTAAADFSVGGANNPTPFAFSSANGDDAYLLEADADGHLLRFVDHVEFGATPNGVSLGRYPDGQGDLVRLCDLSLGVSNTDYCYGPVVLNEIMYNPLGTDANLEYIELYNSGVITEELNNWRLRGEVDYNFGAADALAPDAYALLVGFDPTNAPLATAFRTTYGLSAAVKLIGPWNDNGAFNAQLNNGGATLTLYRPDLWEPGTNGQPGFYPLTIEDQVTYDDAAPWPTTPDGVGPSLELKTTLPDNRDPLSWEASITAQGTPGRNNDDDNPPISVVGSTAAENSGSATFTVTLAHASGLTVTVNYATADGTALAASDYTATSGTLTFAPGIITRTVAVPLTADATYEPNETFTVALTSPVHGTLLTSSAPLTIANDDALPTASINDATVVENAGTAVLTVTLSNPSYQTASVAYATANGTATAANDYTAASGTLTFNPGQTAKTIAITLLDDTIEEPDETLFVNLTTPTNLTLADAQGQITLLDNESAPIISGSAITTTEGSTADWVLTLNYPSAFTVTVAYATADGTATAGTDYTPISGTLTFAPLQTSRTLPLAALADNTDEAATETLTLQLSAPSQATLAQSQLGGTIQDVDSTPSLTMADVSLIEGDALTTTATLTVTLNHASAFPVEVNYATADITATAGADYTAISGTLALAPLQTSATITVPVWGDLLNEVDETLALTLSDPTNATLGTTTATVTILDNDGVPLIHTTAVTVTEGTGGTSNALFTVSLSKPSGLTVTVAYGTQDGTAVETDYTAVSGTLTFAPGQTSHPVPVPINPDTVDEADEQFLFTLAAPTNGTVQTAQVTAVIVDDDTAPTLTSAPITTTEGLTATWQFTLSHPSAFTITVDYATADATATAGTDYAPLSGTLTFAPLQTSHTLTLSTVDDAVDEDDETVQLLLSDPINAVLGAAQVTAVIADDEFAPTLTAANQMVLEGAAGETPTALITLTLSHASAFTSSVDFATLDDTAVAGVDYTAASGTLTFAPLQTSATIPVTILGNNIDEPNRALTVTLSNPVRLSVATPSVAITIVDDEGEPTLTVADVVVNEGDGTAVWTVVLAPATVLTSTAEWTTADGTAVAGADYTAASGTLTFAPSQTSQQIVIAITDDALYELDETVILALSNPVNLALGQNQATATLLSDDAVPQVAVGDEMIVEGNSGATMITFTVTLSAASGVTATVDFATLDDTAVAGVDYTAVNGTLTFAPGQTTKLVQVGVLGNTQYQGNRQFWLQVSNPQAAEIDTATAVATIMEDDTAGFFIFLPFITK